MSLLPGTVLRGRTVVGAGSSIGPNAHVSDAVIGRDVRLGTVDVDRAVIGDSATVGPFSALGPGSEVAVGEVVAAGTHRPF